MKNLTTILLLLALLRSHSACRADGGCHCAYHSHQPTYAFCDSDADLYDLESVGERCVLARQLYWDNENNCPDLLPKVSSVALALAKNRL